MKFMLIYIYMKKYNVFLSIICVILLILIFNWINYLANNNYIKEGLVDRGNPATSHTVDLPLTTTYSCQNKCGPAARCYMTGQQCTADIDCPGCNPNMNTHTYTTKEVPGNDDAGKLTFNITPRYSPLTTDIGTRAKLFKKPEFSKPASPNFGNKIWLKDFKKMQKMYDAVYKPPKLQYMPDYHKRYSLSGDFIINGPLASNASLS